MIRGNLGSATIYEASVLLDALATNRKPAPPELQNVNRLMCPAGEQPARGWFLCLASDVRGLNLDDNLDAHIEYQDEQGNVQEIDFYNLVVTKEPVNLTSSYIGGDPNAMYLVEVSDQRWLLNNPYYTQATYDRQYNVRAPAYVGAKYTDAITNQDPERYCVNTLRGGNPWTWDQMLTDLWLLMAAQLGGYPGLPPGVPGDSLFPEGFIFQGVSAWRALNLVLGRLGCIIKADLTQQDQYTIVQVGAPDSDATNAINTATTQNRKIHDGEFQAVSLGRIPQYARVLFHTLQQAGGERTAPNDNTQWQAGGLTKTDIPGTDTTGSVFAIDKPGPAAGAAQGIYHPLWDDLPAIYAWDHTQNQWALTNKSDLDRRAAVRAADYFRLLTSPGGSRLWLRFSGLVNIWPGSILKGAAYIADGDGVYTEVVCHPFLNLRPDNAGQWAPVEPLEESGRMHAPTFRPTWPLYPEKTEVIKLVNGTPDANGTYDALIQYSDGNGGLVDGPEIWATCLAGASSPTYADGTIIPISRLIDWHDE